MALTKLVTITGFQQVENPPGTVTDLAAILHVQLQEDGVNTQLTYNTMVSVWNQLTAQQKSGVQNVFDKLHTLSYDPPAPRV